MLKLMSSILIEKSIKIVSFLNNGVKRCGGIASLMESPKVRATEFEVFRYGFGFVVENAVFNFVALSGVVNVEGSVVVGELVHDVAEHGKVWNNAGVIFP